MPIHFKKSLLFSALLLCGCVTRSPLLAEENVDIEGKLEHEDGSAYAEAQVTLSAPFNPARTARTNAAGIYRFSLSGTETQVLGAASDIQISAFGGGSHVQQSFKALKTEVRLPTMRFWNGLGQPARDSLLKGRRSVFSWQAPSGGARAYRFRLFDQSGTIWESRNVLTGQEVPLAVLETGRSYQWQVTAIHSDYEASSDSRGLSAEPDIKSVPVRSVRLLSDGSSQPLLHDGSYARAADLDFSSKDGKPKTHELEVQLARKARVQGLHWASSGFSPAIEVRASAGGSPLATQTLDEFSLLEWPAVETDTLYLRVQSSGFVNVKELRILGD